MAGLPVPADRRRIEQAARLVVGRTVHGQLEVARLEAAARMIQDGCRVIDAAIAVGYANPSHFAQLFRRSFGAAPVDWRRTAAVMPGGDLPPDVRGHRPCSD